jgi:branched-chain amino acid transport system substrate-binding protein
MKTKLVRFSVVSFALMAVFVTASFAAPSAPQTIAIGAIVSLSGFDSNLGHQAKAGYEMAVEDINKAGGVLVKEYGKKIPLEVIVQDMESNPQKAVSRMEYLLTSKKVVSYVGTTFISAGSGVAEKNKIPTMVVASAVQGVHERSFKYWFSPVGKSPDTARAVFDILESVPSDKRPKTVAIFQEHTDFGLEQAQMFKAEAEKRNYKVAFIDKYTPMTKDWSPLIMGSKEAGAEVLLTSPITPDGMLMIRQMKELDYNPKAVVAIRAPDDLSWGKALGAAGDYVLLMGGWHYAVKFPGVDKLNAAYEAKFGRPADMQTGPAYASIQIIAAAIEKAGTLDTAKIRDGIAATDMMTTVGHVKFRANGTVIDPCPATIQWQKGAQKLVWPKEFKEADFVYPIPEWKSR